MASVCRKVGSKFWYACYLSADGRRVQITTRLEDREEALGIALARERAARAAREGRFSEASARRFLNEVRAIASLPMAEAPTVKDWLDEWLDSASRGVVAKTRRKYTDCVAGFLSWLGDAKARPIWELSTRTMASWRDSQLDAGKSPSTVNLELSLISRAMTEAVSRRMLEANPCAGLRLRGAEARAQRRQAFTLSQFGQLLDALHGEWRLFVLVLGYTAARQQEAAQIRWSQVDFDRGLITLYRGKKHGAKHVVPIHPVLAEALRQAFRTTQSVFVLPTIAAAKGKSLSKAFREKHLPRIGIHQPYDASEGKGRRLAPLSLHSFRHSLSSWLDEAGATPAEREAMLGHEDPDVNRGYTHADLDRLASALARIPHIGGA